MNGATYLADLAGGQKTGLYLRPAAEPRLRGAAGARAAGARRVRACRRASRWRRWRAVRRRALAVDGSAAALELAAGGAPSERRGGPLRLAARRRLRGDGGAGRRGARASASWSATRRPLRRTRRRWRRGCAPTSAPPDRRRRWSAPDGFLVLCSCSHAADLARFREACLRGIGRAGRAATLILHVGFAGPDHPVHPQLAESAYLKALFLRLGP